MKRFLEAIQMAESLRRRELRYSDPPLSSRVLIVRGLRGGAAVLMVAALEAFIKDCIEECIDAINSSKPSKFKIHKVPIDTVLHNYRRTLDLAARGPYPSGATDADKVTICEQASNVVVSKRLNSAAFTDIAKSNPNPAKIRELFKAFGVKDVFTEMKVDFEAKWGTPVATTFIADTLDSIMQRRHQVAHAANVLSISRSDLETSIRFLKLLAALCESRLKLVASSYC